MSRLDLQTGRVTILEEGSDELHGHPQPVRVEMDPEGLALAIVLAARMARQGQPSRPPRRPAGDSGPRSPAPPSQAPRRILDMNGDA